MDLRKTVSWLALFVGVLFLVIGAATAHAGDYDSEYIGCDKYCQGGSSGLPYATCMQIYCNQFQNVVCANCTGCGTGGYGGCLKYSGNCGDANPVFCNNGLCKCDYTVYEDLGGKYYSCFCKKP